MYTTPIPRAEVAKVLVRMPHGLHDQLKAAAAGQGVSVNTLMAVLLAGGIGFTLDTAHTKEGKSMEQMSKPAVNAETFARAIGANGKTFRRWLRKRGEGVGRGSEYDLPTPDSPAGRQLAADFHARGRAR